MTIFFCRTRSKSGTHSIFHHFIFLAFSLLLPGYVKAQCPSIAAICIDACGTEQNNEFIVINSGGGFFVNDMFIDYDNNNNGFSPFNADININPAPCGVQAGNASIVAPGCTNTIIPAGPGAFIPANSYVIFETSSALNTSYDFSGVCGLHQCIYVIQSSCPRTIGAFTNNGAASIRTTILGTTTGCSTAYNYDRALIANANGAYFIPPMTYGSSGCIAPPVSFGNPPTVPTLTGVPASICQTAASIALPVPQSGIAGSWSGTGVTANNFNPSGLSGNITLTYMPTTGQCAANATTVINVIVPTSPVLSGIPASICQTATSIALPTTQSGITGTWSGTGVTSNNFNPTGLSGNITLTFTPTIGQCAISNTTMINVMVPVNPAISGLPASLCQSDSPIALPSPVSGITGTWSGSGVSGNNFDPSGLNGNVSLTFTPTAGQCANVASTSIIVNVPVMPALSGLPATICEDAATVSLSTTQSGITGTWSGMGVTSNNFDPSGLNGNVTLTFTPTAGQCAVTNTATVNVTSLIVPTISGIPASICATASAINLPTTQSGITGVWSGTGVTGNQFDPTGLNGNITLTFTPNAGQCGDVASTSILVNMPTTPLISGLPATMCENDSPLALSTTQGGITGTWSGTGVAGNNFDPSGLSGNIILTFTPTAGQCASSTTATINVNTAVNPVVSGIPANLCQNAMAIALPATLSGITGTWSGMGVAGNNFNPSGLSGNVMLTFTPSAGQCANVASTSITVDLPVTPAISGVPATICQSAAAIPLPVTQSGITGSWSGTGVSANNFNPTGLSGNVILTFTPNTPQCANVNTATISVTIPVTPVISGIQASICQNAPSIALPTTQSGITGTWSGTGVTANNFNPTGLSGNITLTFTPTAGQCANTNTTSITVNIPVTPAITGIPASICQNASSVSLPTTQSGITGNWTGTGVTANNFNPTGLSGNIMLTFVPNVGQCANNATTNINVIVPTAPAITGVPSSLCENAASINLPSTQSGIAGSWSGPGVSGNMFNPTGLMGNNILTFTPNAGQCALVATKSITINAAPSFINLTQNCDLATQTYTISFDITGGSPGSYTVNGNPVGGSHFTSAPIASGMGYLFNLNDANNCGPVVISGLVNCNCATFSGTMDFSNAPLQFCLGSNFMVDHNGDENLDANDQLDFVIHTNSSGGLGTIISVSSTNMFSFPGNIIPGVTYYISAVAGNNNGSGGVNLSDPCLSVSQGVPVVFYLPSVSISPGNTICQDDCYNFQVQFTGTPPFNLDYTINAAGNNSNHSLSSNAFTTTLSICPSDYGVTSGIIQVTPMLLADDNCSFTIMNPMPQLVTVLPNAIHNLIMNACSGESIVVNGTTYNQAHPSGTEILQSSADNGCDSIVNINLTFFPNPVFDLNQTLCTGGTLTVNGTIYDAAHPTGTEIIPNGSIHGCDSTINVNITFSNVVTFNLDQTLCPGQSIMVNGTTYDGLHPAGSETFPGGSYLGCDSVVIVNLSFYPAAINAFNQTLCTGSFVTINGIVYDEAHPTGTEFLPNASIHGCDSTINVNLSFNSVVTFDLNSTLCFGKNIIVNGTTYDAAQPSGTELFPGGSVNGCDSVVNINLSFYPFITSNLTQTLCAGKQILVNGNIYNAAHPSGTEVLLNASSTGCDSTVVVNLSFFSASTNTISQTLCPGGSVIVNGTLYNSGHSSGIEVVTGGSTHGCDSTITIALSFYNPIVYNLNQTLCVGGSITINGTVYDAGHPSGTEILSNAGIHGCDSTINVQLLFDNVVTHNIDDILCKGDSVIVNNVTYNASLPSGMETFLGGSYLGCDSVVNVNLTFYPDATFNLDTTLSEGESILINGTVYDETNTNGTELLIGASIHGCDSIVIVQVNFLSILVVDIDTISPLCNGGHDGSIVINGNGGLAPYMITVNSNQPVSVNVFPYNIAGLVAGTYTIKVEDAIGNIFTQQVLIDQPAALTVDLGNDLVVELGESITLSAQPSFTVDSWLWTPDTFLDCDDCAAPSVQLPTHDITYSLVATDANGCSAEDEVSVLVNTISDIIVPTVFSPNNDGMNDFAILSGGHQVSQVNYFRIYDRWGGLMFNADDFQPDDQLHGWDGTLKNNAVLEGVYVWVAEVKFLDDHTEVFKGDLTLIR